MKYLLCLLLPIGMLILNGCPNNHGGSSGGGNTPGPTPAGNTTTITIVGATSPGFPSSIKVMQDPLNGNANSVHIAFVTNSMMSNGLRLFSSNDGVTFTPVATPTLTLPNTTQPKMTWFRVQSSTAPTSVAEMDFNEPNGIYNGTYNFSFGAAPQTRGTMFVVDDFYTPN